ncbi:MAG: transposase [Sedimentisphaeraceae bacterium JB056]
MCHSIHYGKGNKAVLNYLSRYVHRVAITNSRILAIDDEFVTFRYKDRKAKRFKTCKVTGHEFMRRYLQHVLPKGFHKVRYYGIWHSSHKYHVLKLVKLMNLFGDCPQPATKKTVAVEQVQTTITPRCPHCKSEHLTLIEKLPRPRSRSPSIAEIFKRLQAHNQ